MDRLTYNLPRDYSWDQKRVSFQVWMALNFSKSFYKSFYLVSVYLQFLKNSRYRLQVLITADLPNFLFIYKGYWKRYIHIFGTFFYFLFFYMLRFFLSHLIALFKISYLYHYEYRYWSMFANKYIWLYVAWFRFIYLFLITLLFDMTCLDF